jgi:DNA-binding NarL/FixJ family response regulator
LVYVPLIFLDCKDRSLYKILYIYSSSPFLLVSGVAVMPNSAILVDGNLIADRRRRDAGLIQDSPSGAPVQPSVIVALIDCVQFNRDCLIQVLRVQSPELAIVPFASIRECINDPPADLQMILYYAHQHSPSQLPLAQTLSELRKTFAVTPIVVLSDSSVALQPGTVSAAISSGAQGYIPTANTAMTAGLAAIRLVKDGGTVAPVDVLLAKHTRASTPSLEQPPSKLTQRQMMVLSQLRQGKANKIIAYELGMSESTVKVHVRNIMRRMGATNRTQAVYRSHQLLPA